MARTDEGKRMRLAARWYVWGRRDADPMICTEGEARTFAETYGMLTDQYGTGAASSLASIQDVFALFIEDLRRAKVEQP